MIKFFNSDKKDINHYSRYNNLNNIGKNQIIYY